jgi:hypothetical protein
MRGLIESTSERVGTLLPLSKIHALSLYWADFISIAKFLDT